MKSNIFSGLGMFSGSAEEGNQFEINDKPYFSINQIYTRWGTIVILISFEQV